MALIYVNILIVPDCRLKWEFRDFLNFPRGEHLAPVDAFQDVLRISPPRLFLLPPCLLLLHLLKQVRDTCIHAHARRARRLT